MILLFKKSNTVKCNLSYSCILQLPKSHFDIRGINLNSEFKSKIKKILETENNTEILLISPPFSLLDFPCLGLEILNNIAIQKSVKTTILYANLLFADYIGIEKYNYIVSKLSSLYSLIGERIFIEAAYKKMPIMGENAPFDKNAEVYNLFQITFENLSHLANIWTETLSQEIAKSNYKVVGVTTGHQQTNAAIAIINHIKNYNPSIITFIGGSACDGDMAEGVLSLSKNINYVFSGESEISWGIFLEQYKKNILPKEKIIKSIYLSNLDQIPFYSKSYKNYISQLQLTKKDIDKFSILYETSRGCWWAEKNKCNFCGVNGCDKIYRSKTESKIFSDIQMLMNTHKNIKHIQMVDTLMPRKFSYSLLPNMKKLIGDTTLFYEQRADLKLQEVINLKLNGIKYCQVGIEALSTDILKLINKGMTASQNIKFLRWARSAGLLIGWNLLTEIPGDKKQHWESVLKLIPLIYHLNPPLHVRSVEIVRFSPYYEKPEKYGISSLKPNKIYSEVFPKSAKTLHLAWMFDSCYKSESKDNIILKKQIKEAFDIWINKWKTSVQNIPKLRVFKENELFFLEDSRTDKYLKTLITKEQAKISLFGVSKKIKNIDLEWAIKNRVIYKLDNLLIPLATANPNLLKEFKNEK